MEICDGSKGCPLCNPTTGAEHIFRKRDRLRWRRRRSRRKLSRKARCTCFFCTPGRLKREAQRARDDQRLDGVPSRLARRGRTRCNCW